MLLQKNRQGGPRFKEVEINRLLELYQEQGFQINYYFQERRLFLLGFTVFSEEVVFLPKEGWFAVHGEDFHLLPW